MKTRLSTTVAAIGALSFFGTAAHAADLIQQPVYVPPAPVVEQPVSTSGWYLRGDVGYVFKNDTEGDYSFYNQYPGVQGVDDVFHYDSIKTDGAADFGVGVGYRFTDNLRMDATVDYFKADVKGSSDCISYVTAGMGLAWDNDCHYDDSSKVAIWTALANAYVDLGTYGRFTPYIGAGLGFAHVKYDEMHNEMVCGSDPACAGQTNYVGTHEGQGSWRFASSLTAGATVDITHALKFDAGYRYTHINGGDAFGYDEADRSFGASGVQGRDHGFNIHTVRAGLRYEFGGGNGWGKGKEPVYAEAPLYTEPAPLEPAPVYK